MVTSLSNRTTRILALALALGGSSVVEASTLVPLSLRDRIQKAELVAQATVLSVKHRISTVARADQAWMPHTFVTFRIEQVIKGSATAGDSLTLRFLGGPRDGITLSVDGIPKFRVGDRDVLFASRNGQAMCPVVGWEQGRFRVVEGQIFDDHGRDMWLTPSNEIVFGRPRLDLDRFPYRIRHEVTRSGPKRPGRFTPPAGSLRPDADGFTAILRHMTRTLYAAGAMTRPAPIVDLDPEGPFFVLGPRPVDVPSETESELAPKLSEEEKLERARDQ